MSPLGKRTGAFLDVHSMVLLASVQAALTLRTSLARFGKAVPIRPPARRLLPAYRPTLPQRKRGTMLVFLLLTTILAMPPSSPPLRAKRSSLNPNPNSSSFLLCKHSPSATIDLLIFVLVLFSSLFLVASSISHLFRSLSLLLPPSSFSLSPLPLYFSFLVAFAFAFSFFALHRGGFRSRKCGKPKCKGMKKAMEFDIQLQTEECLRSAAATEIDELPWKGGTEGNPDYDCLRSELRRMAPLNGRAILLFKARCGCPVAKLEAWGPKRGRRHKKGVPTLAIEGGRK